MNKVIILAILGIALGIIGIKGYLVLSNITHSSLPSSVISPSITPVNNTVTKAPAISPTIVPERKKNTINELMKGATPQICTFKDVFQNTGVLYFGGGNFRGDFFRNAEGKIPNNHVIVDSAYMYIWFDGKESGMKFSKNRKDYPRPSIIPTASYDFNKYVEYDCSPWSVDRSKFIPPAMQFEDYTSGWQKRERTTPQSPIPSHNTQLNTSPCETCKNFPPDVAAQCLQNYSCQ